MSFYYFNCTPHYHMHIYRNNILSKNTGDNIATEVSKQTGTNRKYLELKLTENTKNTDIPSGLVMVFNIKYRLVNWYQIFYFDFSIGKHDLPTDLPKWHS